jgi:hypothetical protein
MQIELNYIENENISLNPEILNASKSKYFCFTLEKKKESH